MKVLLISNKYAVSAEPLRKAFMALGCQVRTVDYWDHPLLMPHGSLQRLIGKLPLAISTPLRNNAQKKIDKTIWKTAQEFQPDLIFATKAKSLSHELLEMLRTIGTTANWYSETMDHWDRIKQTAPQYDFFFNFDPYVVERMKAEGNANVYYLPFCADVAKDTQWEQPQPKYNVTFVGSFLAPRYNEREIVLNEIKDLGLHVWGNKAWEKTTIASHYHGWLSNYEDVAQVYRHSKIVINIHLPDVSGSGINFRPFEVAAAGALLINHSSRRDIFNVYEAGKEFISFDGSGDIREKVAYYLIHDQERTTIARAGFERTRRDHTYIDRAQQVLNIVRAHK